MKQTIKILVKLRSGKNSLKGYDKAREAYVVEVKSAPEKGKANLDVLKVLTKHFKKKIRIISGLKNRTKIVEIED